MYAPGSGGENESASVCEEWVNWINVSAAWLWYVSFKCERRTYRRALSWMRLRANWCMESPGRHCKSLRSLWPRTVQTIVSVWHPTGSASSPSGVFPSPLGGEDDVSLPLLRWCAMRDQKPAPSGPWSGSAYWTQVSEPVLLRASPVCPSIPRPAKRRLGLRELW